MSEHIQLLSFVEAAELLTVCPRTVSRLAKEGRLELVKITSKVLRVTEASVRRHVADQVAA